MAHCPVSAGPPRFEIADIVRAHRAELERKHCLTLTQRRVLSAIELCRTAALGGHLDVCRQCGFERPAYNSCRNRHCPKCQALAQEKWIAARSEQVLPIGHFHVVFTLPSELRGLSRVFSRCMFDALFRAASETLLELGRSRFGGLLGVTMVLHTWTRDLRFHPHVHAIVSAGVLDTAGVWQPTSSKYLLPVAMMAAVFRGKILHFLRRMRARGLLRRDDQFHDPEAFERLTARLAHIPSKYRAASQLDVQADKRSRDVAAGAWYVRQTEDRMAEHAVIVRFTYAGDNLDPLFVLERRLEGAIANASVGEFDGNEIASDLRDGALSLLAKAGMSSAYALMRFVVATALDFDVPVLATGDSEDLARLLAPYRRV